MPKQSKIKNKKRAKKVTAMAGKMRIQKKVFSIIAMPEDRDEAPHWLYWLLLIVFIVLIISVVWAEFSSTPSIQTYLPHL